MCLVDKIALQMQVLMKQFPVHEVPVLLELIFSPRKSRPLAKGPPGKPLRGPGGSLKWRESELERPS